MIGIVNKPQFDTSVFTVGKAIHIKNNKGFGFEEVVALINQSSPLEIIVSYYNKQEKLSNMTISIQDVTDGNYTINFFSRPNNEEEISWEGNKKEMSWEDDVLL